MPDGPPDHILVQGLNQVTHDLLELTQVAGLDCPDLLVTDAQEEVVTQGYSPAMQWFTGYEVFFRISSLSFSCKFNILCICGMAEFL